METKIKYSDIKKDMYVGLHKKAISDMHGNIFKGYEEYYNVPVKITAVRPESKRDATYSETSFTIEKSFGIYIDDIKHIYTRDECPEYYL